MYFGAVGGPDFVFPKWKRPDKVNGDEEIYNSMKTTSTYHMLLFLNYSQKKFDAINSEFQSKSFRLHRLYTTNCGDVKTFLGCFFKNDLLSSKALSTVNPSHPNFSKNLHKFILEADTRQCLWKRPWKIMKRNQTVECSSHSLRLRYIRGSHYRNTILLLWCKLWSLMKQQMPTGNLSHS